MVGLHNQSTVRCFVVIFLIVWFVTPATAQPPQEPIGLYVIDLQGSFVPFSRNVELAENRGLNGPDTPGAGAGYQIGAHVYPFRWHVITFGIGASFHSSLADQRPGERSPNPDGPTLRKRFTAVAPQLSFNFGGRDGWSYLSGGITPSRLSLFPLNVDPPQQRRSGTLNYGGGVRWFVNDRVAFSIDLRLYAISPIEQVGDVPGSPRMTQMTLNIGASFR